MRSVRPNNALTELDWAVAGVWMLGLMTVRQIPRTVRWSVAPAFRVVRRVMSRPHARGPKLRRLLRRAVQDTDVRRHGKTARNRPHKKTDPPAPPNIRVATRSEIRRAQGLKRCARRNALTALGGIRRRIEPLKKFARKLKEYLGGILAHCRWRLHTILLEGINNKIKVIKRMAYGFHDDQYFFLKIRRAFPGNGT